MELYQVSGLVVIKEKENNTCHSKKKNDTKFTYCNEGAFNGQSIHYG